MNHPAPLTRHSSANRVFKFISMLLAAGFLLGRGVQAQTVVFSENFEGIFNTWTVGDLNTEGVPAYWSDVNVAFGTPFPHGGNWMGYCAGVGFAGSSTVPFYQDDMFGYMERTANLISATGASLSFWYNAPSLEEGIDFLAVYVDGTPVFTHSSVTFGWQQATINLNSYVGGNRVIRFAFVSDDSIMEEGYYLDDIVLTATLPQQANLTPYQRNGWSDKIVVSTTTNTSTDSLNLQAGVTLYVDWAVINNGSAASPGSSTQLYINDVLRNTWSGGSLQPNSFSFVNDYNIGSLAAGTHTLRLRADSGNTVSESNETDNEYTKTIVVGGTPDIHVSPLTLSFNVTNNGGSGFTASAMETSATEETAIALSPEQKLQFAHEVTQRFNTGAGRVDVIVNFVPPAGKPGRAEEWNSKPRLQQWHRAVKQRQDEVLEGLAPDDLRVVHRLQNQSTVTGSVTRKGFDQLARHPRVASIEIVREVKPHLAQGIPLMNASLYRATYNGGGVAIAIVDSGVDYTHPRLGGGGFPNAKVIGGYDFGDNDANPQAAGNAHGTACAGIAAGDLGTTGDYIGGVAPNAKIYALKITAGSSGSANDAAIIAAWDWCITHRNDDPANPILVISTSFGGQRHFNPCDGVATSYATAANNAVAAGLTLLVSSGNEGFCDSLASPACLSSVLSVGAVYDAAYGTTTFCIDAVSCVSKTQDFACTTGWETDDVTAADKVTRYSNTATFLSLLAPAHQAHTTDIVGTGGYTTGDYATGFGGTSAACPYAAGAVAALQSAARLTQGRFLTPSEVRARLTSTGDLITDAKSGVTTPRVNLGRAIESLGLSSAFTIFNDGNAHLSVTSIVAETSAPWVTWSPPAPFTIAPGAAQVVAVSIDPAQAPIGPSTRRLLIHSDDPDETPYPGGVFINVTNVSNQPTLTATRSGSRVIISWTADSANYILQSSTNITGSTWGTVSPSPTTIGNLKYVTNNITDPRRFYRLRR